ncbi:uncharacterized protein J3D65DRAFT_637952 [Phyllosticta citribraziliensis]|uniref:Uncharacterized protein n=1 Tax=Phyllosticta citribraziliensis TaxID=989973 RepID=A0ABR1L8I5_9PEZI
MQCFFPAGPSFLWTLPSRALLSARTSPHEPRTIHRLRAPLNPRARAGLSCQSYICLYLPRFGASFRSMTDGVVVHSGVAVNIVVFGGNCVGYLRHLIDSTPMGEVSCVLALSFSGNLHWEAGFDSTSTAICESLASAQTAAVLYPFSLGAWMALSSSRVLE